MKTVLVVEDTEDYAENIRFILSQAGYNAVIAPDGQQGLETALRIKPDLILMDVFMPVLDGVEATARIREQESLKEVPIIFLTSVTAGEDVVVPVMGKDFPAMSKMVDHEKLLARIRKCIG